MLCAGTGNVYPPFPAYTRPNILDYTQAAELDGQFFFSGTPWEMVGRNYTAITLNMANNSTLTQYDVTGKRLCSLPSLPVQNTNEGSVCQPPVLSTRKTTRVMEGRKLVSPASAELAPCKTQYLEHRM